MIIVDDCEDQRYIVKRTLNKWRPTLEIVEVENGQAALDYLEKSIGNLPDVMLLDLNMPGLSGLDTLVKIKSKNSLKHLPICIYSNGEAPEEIRRAYDKGASFYFKKPMEMSELDRFSEIFLELWFDFATI